MDINSTTNITFDSGENNIPSQAVRQTASSREQAEAADAELRNEYDTVIRRALIEDQAESVKLQQIREELDTNRLDTAKNAQIAAQNILKFGI